MSKPCRFLPILLPVAPIYAQWLARLDPRGRGRIFAAKFYDHHVALVFEQSVRFVSSVIARFINISTPSNVSAEFLNLPRVSAPFQVQVRALYLMLFISRLQNPPCPFLNTLSIHYPLSSHYPLFRIPTHRQALICCLSWAVSSIDRIPPLSLEQLI
jgi:hypothetical protein